MDEIPEGAIEEAHGIIAHAVEQGHDYFQIKKEMQAIAQSLGTGFTMEETVLPPGVKTSPEELQRQTMWFGKGTKFGKSYKLKPIQSSHKVMPKIAFREDYFDPEPVKNEGLPSLQERMKGPANGQMHLARKLAEVHEEEGGQNEVFLAQTVHKEPVMPVQLEESITAQSLDSQHRAAGSVAFLSCSGLFFLLGCFLVITIVFEVIKTRKYCFLPLQRDSPSSLVNSCIFLLEKRKHEEEMEN